MYLIDDTVSALKEVQRLLNVNMTGIYDETTRKAVEKIQIDYQLETVDKVNYATFNAILNEYKKRKFEVLDLQYLFNPAFPYMIGEMGDNIGLINDAMRLVLEDYVYEDITPKGKYLGENTITAANFLRKIFKMELSDKIDKAFVQRLLLEKSAIERKENTVNK